MAKTLSFAVLLVALSGCMTSADKPISAQALRAEIREHTVEPCYTLMAEHHQGDVGGKFFDLPISDIKQAFKSDQGLAAHMQKTTLAISQEVRNTTGFRERRQVYDRHVANCKKAISML